MRDHKNIRNWIKSFFAGVLVFIFLISVIMYIVDPFFQYRVRDNQYLLSARFVSAGLIKNYDYDTLVLGSSMTQNFNMERFRNELGNRPLHIGLGGMKNSEMLELIRLAESVNKASAYYLCIDLNGFVSNDEGELYGYLLKDDLLSKLRYSLSFEAWVRYIPIDISLSFFKELGVSLPYKVTSSMSIDDLDNWNDDYEFGKNIVLNNYKNSLFSVSKINTNNLLNTMKVNIDMFFTNLQTNNKAINLFFPPYSALYWANSEKEGYLDSYLAAKRYFVEKAIAKGYNVFDFQSVDLTLNLDNYKDTTHYKQEINDYMIDCFASLENKLNLNLINDYEVRLKSNIEKIKLEIKDDISLKQGE